MKNGKQRDIQILIKPTHDGHYLAYFSSDFLKATYSVYFEDTIMGAIALNGFADMIRRRYKVDSVMISLEDEYCFMNKAVNDVLEALTETEPVLIN